MYDMKGLMGSDNISSESVILQVQRLIASSLQKTTWWLITISYNQRKLPTIRGLPPRHQSFFRCDYLNGNFS